MFSTTQKSQQIIDTIWHGIIAIAISMVVFTLPFEAIAGLPGQSGTTAGTGANNVLSSLFCNVVLWMTGPIGKGIATLAIVVIGLGALLGKIAWGMALIVGLGIALIFGAVTIVNSLGGAEVSTCRQTTVKVAITAGNG